MRPPTLTVPGGEDEGPLLLREVQRDLASVARSIGSDRASLQDVEARLGDLGESHPEAALLREVVQFHSSLIRSMVWREAQLQDAGARLALLSGVSVRGGGDAEAPVGSRGGNRDGERGRGGEQAPGGPAQR